MTTKTIDDAVRAAPRHWNVDGLPEMLGGVLLVAWGALLIWHELSLSRLSAMSAAVGPLLLIVLLIASDQILLPRIKARLTDSRVGYARPRVSGRQRALAAGIGVVAGAAMALWIASGGAARQHSSTMVAGLAALFLVYCAWRLRLPRFLVYAVVAVAAAVVVPRSWPPDLALGAIQVALGSAAALGGSWTLARLLRGSPSETA